jgi:hypothetical protein
MLRWSAPVGLSLKMNGIAGRLSIASIMVGNSHIVQIKKNIDAKLAEINAEGDGLGRLL